MPATLTPQKFVNKWRKYTLKKRIMPEAELDSGNLIQTLIKHDLVNYEERTDGIQ